MKHLLLFVLVLFLFACSQTPRNEIFEPKVYSSPDDACPNGEFSKVMHEGVHLTNIDDVREHILVAPKTSALPNKKLMKDGNFFLMEDGFYRCKPVDEKFVSYSQDFRILDYKISSEYLEIIFANNIGTDLSDVKISISNELCADVVELGDMKKEEQATVQLKCHSERVLDAELGFRYTLNGKTTAVSATIRGMVKE